MNIRFASAGIALVGVFLGNLVAPAPAQAATVSPITYATAQSPHNSNDDKSVRATCPSGLRVIGGAASISADAGVFARITHQFPFFDLFTGADSFYDAGAVEEQVGLPGNWTLFVRAVCANPLPGQVIVSNTSGRSSASPQIATVRCPDNTRVLAGFGSIGFLTNRIVLEDVIPNTDLTTVTAIAYEDQAGFADTWFVRVYAICANPVTGLVRELPASSVFDSDDDKGFTVRTCRPGRRAVSVSGEIFNGAGQVGQFGSFIDLTSGRFKGREDRDGYSADWSQHTYVICVT